MKKGKITAAVLASVTAAAMTGGIVTAVLTNKADKAEQEAAAESFNEIVANGNILANEIVVGLNQKSEGENQHEWNSAAEINSFTLKIVSGKYGSRETWQESLGQSGKEDTLKDEDSIQIEGVRYFDSANENLSQPFNITFNLSEGQLEQLNAQTGLAFGEQEKKAEFEKNGPGSAPLHKYTIYDSAVFYGGNYAPKDMSEYNSTTREYSTQKSTAILECVYNYLEDAYEHGNTHGVVGQTKSVKKEAPQKIEAKVVSVGDISLLENKMVKTQISMIAYDANNKDNPAKLVTFDVTFSGAGLAENETAIFGGDVQDLISNVKKAIESGSTLTGVSGNKYSAKIENWTEVGLKMTADMVQGLANYDESQLKLEERARQNANKTAEAELGGFGME